MRVCITCDEGEVSEHSRTGVCPACQSSLSYWKKKSPARVMLRRKRLGVYQTRLATWFDTDGKREKEKASGKKLKIGPVTQLLIKARGRLVKFQNHTRGATARGPDGLPIKPNDPRAVCWCAVGALYWASDTADLTPLHEAERKSYDLLAAASRDIIKVEGLKPAPNSITVVNDGSGHKGALALYNKAIILAGGK